MLREERHNLILKAVEGREAVSYEELLSLVDASSATIRRDVDQLCDSGQLRKLRGGIAPIAVASARPLSGYYFKDETKLHSAAKDAIARAALGLVQSPDSLILFGGSTVARFAERLPTHGLTVLTDSIPVANHLAYNTENRVFMTGGEVFAQQGIVLSPFDDAPLFHFAASTFFMGCHAVTEAGVLEDDPLPLRVARTLRRQAQRIVVLADSSKFSASRSLVIFPLNEVDIFVTDDGISEHAVQMIEAAGSKVVIANRDLNAVSPIVDRSV
ncbi:DeoR/GlpR family DNA-binding transcription regulator [Oryzibacter oryziterrae]|uniref:DeoR/GlpR family DNA-binding transcription regulator n=1 Tax=Oryzibacter oryziterrae TaxID=2766474 RepID=UPI001F47CDD8|nr:DeoR/GlpR family DNA-binding transcription regulator [Oryzibacter oryziterrae]